MEMSLLTVVALMGIVVYVELLVFETRLKRYPDWNYGRQPVSTLSDGADLIEGADGELHRPGCKFAAPPVRIVIYQKDEMESRPFCPECNPNGQTLEKAEGEENEN